MLTLLRTASVLSPTFALAALHTYPVPLALASACKPPSNEMEKEEKGKNIKKMGSSQEQEGSCEMNMLGPRLTLHLIVQTSALSA